VKIWVWNWTRGSIKLKKQSLNQSGSFFQVYKIKVGTRTEGSLKSNKLPTLAHTTTWASPEIKCPLLAF
jgi:hypothetical protein